MATQRQIESAHINGAKSRGPKTPEGKRRSAANARKHGLASKTISRGAETSAEFNASVAQYVADLRPASPTELLLINQMVAAEIRQRQCWTAETDAWNRALAAHDGCTGTAFHALAESNELACILRYETRFKRQYDRALKEFLTMRELRLRNEPGPSAPSNTILPNEPDLHPHPSPPPLLTFFFFAKRTGLPALHPEACS